MRHIKKESLGERVAVPPVQEQAELAAFLDRETAKIDTLIAKQERLIELLKEKRQAVISHAVTKGLDLTVPIKPSGVEWLGDVPEHWKVIRLKNILTEPLMYGANESAESDDRSMPRFIRITDIDGEGNLRDETFKSLPPEVAEPYLLEHGDVLLARRGATVGKSFIYSSVWGNACFAGYLIRARLNRDIFLSKFFAYCCQTNFYWQYIASVQIQATIQNVSAEKYANFVFPCPSVTQQYEIVTYLDSLTSKIDALVDRAEQAILLQKEHRSALISAAVTGKIDVRNAVPELQQAA